MSKNNRTLKRWFTAIATVVTVVVFFVIVRTQGYVAGSEFSPTRFQQREFSFYEIPLLHIQITPIQRSGSTPAAATYVRQTGLIPRLKKTEEDWHLVSISRGLGSEKPRDPKLLMDQLELGGNDEYWRTWSKNKPEHAKILWPLIQKLSIRELYLLMPSLFETAQIEQSAAELQASLDAQLQSEYVKLVEDMRAAERDDLADALLSEAMLDYPENEAIRNLQRPKS